MPTTTMPELPPKHFFRVTTLLGSPIIELHRKKFLWFTEKLWSRWLDDASPEDIIANAHGVWEAYSDAKSEEDTLNLNLAQYGGDYPPKSLSVHS